MGVGYDESEKSRNMRLERITINPAVATGKPCIRNLRITVYDVLEYLASGMSQEEIVKDFPELTKEDIRACLAFAADRERRPTRARGSSSVHASCVSAC